MSDVLKKEKKSFPHLFNNKHIIIWQRFKEYFCGQMRLVVEEAETR